jgi:hypothetical protein
LKWRENYKKAERIQPLSSCMQQPRSDENETGHVPQNQGKWTMVIDREGWRDTTEEREKWKETLKKLFRERAVDSCDA